MSHSFIASRVRRVRVYRQKTRFGQKMRRNRIGTLILRSPPPFKIQRQEARTFAFLEPESQSFERRTPPCRLSQT